MTVGGENEGYTLDAALTSPEDGPYRRYVGIELVMGLLVICKAVL